MNTQYVNLAYLERLVGEAMAQTNLLNLVQFENFWLVGCIHIGIFLFRRRTNNSVWLSITINNNNITSSKVRLEHVISFSDAIFAFSMTFMAISTPTTALSMTSYDGSVFH
jgi:hypothetical protein